MTENIKRLEHGSSQKKTIQLLLLVILPILGIGLVLFHTRFGPGASGDSSFYVMGAQNILAGNGFYRFSGGFELRPITGFPPGFSAVLALLGLPGFELFQTARFLNATLFGFNILLAGVLVRQESDSSLAALFAQTLILFSPTQFDLHSWVMSEPLYQFLLLLIILLMVRYVSRQSTQVLFLSGLLTAASMLTRYVGASLLLAASIIILASGPKKFARRFIHLGLYLILALSPLVIWFRRNASVAGTLTNREVIYHPMRPELMNQYLAELSSWFFPNLIPLPTLVRAGLAVLLAVGLAIAFGYVIFRSGWIHWERSDLKFRFEQGTRASLPLLLLLYIVGHIAILILNSTFLDAATTASAPPRYLAPIYLASVLFFILAGYEIIERRSDLVLTVFLIGALSLTGGIKIGQTLQVMQNPLEASGYMGRRLLWPATTEYLRKIEMDKPILSNNPELVYILAGRPAYVRPIRFDAYRLEEREDYPQQITATVDKLKRGGIYIIFGDIEEIDRDVIKATQAEELVQLPHGIVYGYPQSQ